jgi:hypothetical protein
MMFVEWIRLEIGDNSPKVLTRRPWREHNSKEQYAKDALSQVWDWTDSVGPQPLPDPRGPAARAEAVRFIDDSGVEVWRLTYKDVWNARHPIKK